MRFNENPLITPADVKPSDQRFEVACVLNAGVARYKDETILLLRVGERPAQEEGWVSTPVLDMENDGTKVFRVKLDDPDLRYDDPRKFHYKENMYLTTMSHLRIARSTDGVNFTVDQKPFIYAHGPEEEYGVEDSRITRLGDSYYIYYVAVSRNSYCTRMVRTTDFAGIQSGSPVTIFYPQNKDAAIFEGTLKDGTYVAFHRPDIGLFNPRPAIWLAYSSNRVDWGRHKLLISPRVGSWDSGRVGAGTVPILTEKGWFSIYHGADERHLYSLGLLLLDANDPSRIIYRSTDPIFTPEAEYEKKGFFGNVVFTNGMAYYPERDGFVNMYYGAADTYICGARFQLNNLLEKCHYN